MNFWRKKLIFAIVAWSAVCDSTVHIHSKHISSLQLLECYSHLVKTYILHKIMFWQQWSCLSKIIAAVIPYNAAAVLLMVTSVYTKLGMHYKCELMRCHKFSQGCPKIYLDMLPIKYTFLNVCDPIVDTVLCCEDFLAQML